MASDIGRMRSKRRRWRRGQGTRNCVGPCAAVVVLFYVLYIYFHGDYPRLDEMELYVCHLRLVRGELAGEKGGGKGGYLPS